MVVVDTDVVSMEFKGDRRFRAYRRHLIGRLSAISFMTLAELDLWVLQRNWGEKRRQEMDCFLQKFATYPYDRDLCRRWAMIRDGAYRRGRAIDVADAWIAATALALGAPLVTHNPDDYAGVDGLAILSEATGMIE